MQSSRAFGINSYPLFPAPNSPLSSVERPESNRFWNHNLSSKMRRTRLKTLLPLFAGFWPTATELTLSVPVATEIRVAWILGLTQTKIRCFRSRKHSNESEIVFRKFWEPVSAKILKFVVVRFWDQSPLTKCVSKHDSKLLLRSFKIRFLDRKSQVIIYPKGLYRLNCRK